MNAAFPDADVTNYENLIPALNLPDEDDRHVMAAAIRGKANVIVTENSKDFPKDYLIAFDIEVLSADEFLSNGSSLIVGLCARASNLLPGPKKKKAVCRNSRPLTIACQTKKV